MAYLKFFRGFLMAVLSTTRQAFLEEQEENGTTVCIYSTSEKQHNFGRIETFVNTSPPQALIRTLSHSQESILQQAGPPFRPALALYKDVDLLATFIHVLDIKTYM